MTSNSSDDDHDAELARLRAVAEGERANAAHWRAKADRDTAALQALRRKTSVRIALNLERRVEPALRAARRVRAKSRAGTARPASPARATHEPRVDFAITTAAPSEKIADRWGDSHFARDLARALERLGYSTRIYTADRTGSITSDDVAVHLAVRGLAPFRPVAGRPNVLWIISHPEAVDERECDDADLVFVASERFATELRTRTTTPVELLLQATDHHRFVPRPPDPRYAHPLTFVAKTREVLRPIVADTLAAGLRPTIYGSGWEGFVAPDLIAADYVSNDLLPVVYASAEVLLNDHWDTMRAWGFVSNRLFDALACATPVVSDDLPEIADLFGSAVATYEPTGAGATELGRIVEAAWADPGAARARAEAGRARVLDAHTFDHRARTLTETLHRIGLLALP